jgi:hypothetical protein
VASEKQDVWRDVLMYEICMSMSMTIGVFDGIAMYWYTGQGRACSGVWVSQFEYPVSRNGLLLRVTVQYGTFSMTLGRILHMLS